MDKSGGSPFRKSGVRGWSVGLRSGTVLYGHFAKCGREGTAAGGRDGILGEGEAEDAVKRRPSEVWRLRADRQSGYWRPEGRMEIVKDGGGPRLTGFNGQRA